MSASQRKGAASISAVDDGLKAALESGTASSKTLSEILAIDLSKVIENVFGQRIVFPDPLPGIVGRMKICGDWVQANGFTGKAEVHESDIVRGFAAYAVAAENSTIPGSLHSIKRLAADEHFGVREWAWLALRPQVASQVDQSLEFLSTWSLESDENLRRFASEITRPRGVWCSHLGELKSAPQRGLSVLEPLKSDPSKYVRDSVANWLNDAGKTQPGWVLKVCQRWSKESPTTETEYIVKRATRNLK